MKRFIVLPLLVLVISCGDKSSFKAGVDTAKLERDGKATTIATTTSQQSSNQTGKPVTTDGQVSQKPSKYLTLEASSRTVPLDMVWVIDNSSSMKDEVAQVRANVSKFAQDVGSESSLRLSVISTDKGDYGLNLTAMSGDFYQEKFEVGSWNLMTVAAAAVCEASGTAGTNEKGINKVCDKAASTPIPTTGPAAGFRDIPLENSDKLALSVAGKLHSRMREDAVRVFVFVSDDIAEGAVSDVNFLKMFEPSNGKVPVPQAASTHVYAFASFNNPNCPVSREGVTYSALAKATGGEVFDICASDWSAHFSKLKQNLQKLVNNVFEIDSSIAVVRSVKIGSQLLSANQYTFVPGKLTLLDKALLSDGAKVVVEHE